MKKRVPLVEQGDKSECGIAVASMILQYFGLTTTLLDLEQRYGVPRGGTSFSNLVSILNDYGIKCKGVRMRSASDLGLLPMPAVCHWNGDHFVVLEKYSRDIFTVVDPAQGRLKYSKQEFEDSFTGVVILIEGIDVRPKSKPARIIFGNSLVALVKRLSGSVYLIAGLTLASQILSLAFVFAQRWIIDNVTSLQSGISPLMLILCLGSAALVYYILQSTRVLCATNFQLAFERLVQFKFMQRMIEFPMRFFAVHGTGDLLFRINSTSLIQQVISQRLLVAVVDVTFASVYLVVMLVFSPILATIVILQTTVIAAISLGYSVRNRDLVSRGVHREVAAQEILAEYFGAIETYKSLGIEEQILDRWKLRFFDKQAFDRKKGILAARLNTAGEALSFILPMLLLCVGLKLSLGGHVSLGTVIGFLSLAGAFLTPVTTVLESLSQLITVKTYISKVSEILDFVSPDDERSGSLELNESLESIEANEISFRYSAFEPLCVDHLSISVNRGDRIAIVGPSGSGKSTLLKLLSGMLYPYSGTVTVNGVDSRKYHRNSLSRYVAYSSQDSSLFSGSILENISLSDNLSEADYSKLRDICDELGVSELISNSPMGLYTNISNGGSNVSGGQKQRIILARSLFSEAEFLLLDEPTSALDSLSETKVFSYLSRMSKTIVVVAHRLETIRHFDKIFVMDEGAVVESGTHAELLAQGGLYSRLYR
ncbi:MAG: peptidase domain-containing ABC transporter [Actinomycetaceae bacterium]|nr:peptidase domain-containing ABC transporter [Arcanobacterium sp.]MCI7550737.1 peptidase domain-containing ABC transporter [Arcanobacterium sp.]MDD7505059.1 peptidase domain-containing ABC transporter [Actinomycetaceae bacterium]MDY5273676.1 peptidase domain-containing ABC transporter [Arcanobacterium sp.]